MRQRWSQLQKFTVVLLSLQALMTLALQLRHLFNASTSRTTSPYDDVYLLAPSNLFQTQLANNLNDTTFSTSPAEIVRSLRHYNDSPSTPQFPPPATIYLEYAWVDMHSEIFYSILREFCIRSSNKKDPIFDVDANPKFYLGPVQRITPHTVAIWKEFNDTASCGSVHIGTPDDPDLTVLTTTYADQTYTPEFIAKYVNNSKYLLICHDDKPEMETATNVYWLTPLHRNYFIPNYFPPSIVECKQKLARKNVPIFLVIGNTGTRLGERKRNILSLIPILEQHRNEQFIIRIMGSHLPPFFNRTSPYCKKMWCEKIEHVHSPDTYNFMTNVTVAHAVLPLVDETNLYTVYEGGKKLSSSVMWAQGFGLRLVLYRELAYIYNVRDGYIYDESPKSKKILPNISHWESKSGHKRTFVNAFGECLRQFKADADS